MIRFFTLLTCITLSYPVWATAYDRPIPQAQSATAEFWFLLASATLIASLIAVSWLVNRR